MRTSKDFEQGNKYSNDLVHLKNRDLIRVEMSNKSKHRNQNSNDLVHLNMDLSGLGLATEISTGIMMAMTLYI